MRCRILLLPAALLLPALFSLACGDDVELVASPPPGTDAAAGSGGGDGDASLSDGSGGTGGVIVPEGGGTGGGGEDADPCSSQSCSQQQHCEVVSGAAACVGNDCATLGCSPTQVCVPTDGGALCKDNTCASDLACAADQYCNGTLCVPDVCTAGAERCDGQAVLHCASNGGSEQPMMTCGGIAHFKSQCQDLGAGHAACSCEDDWDCPAFTDCDSGLCVGTGVQPICALPPAPFANVLPVNEITWGGTFANPVAAASAFPSSTQVVMAPVVANLDDDTGDGIIDERDFPEIIFTTFCSHDFTSNGILRAIHGGGPSKGQDYFASCGTTVWKEGTPVADVTCACADGELDSTASLAVGDLDYDGVPEIVAITEGTSAGSTTAEVRIYDNRGGILATSEAFAQGGANPAPAIANVDNEGFAEIVVGRSLFTLFKPVGGTLAFADRFQGSLNAGVNSQGPVPCIANLLGDSRQEIIAGSTVYKYPKAPAGAVRQADCTGAETDPDEVAWCAGQLQVAWDGQAVNGTTALPGARRDGFCAVADVLGADQAEPPGPANPLDQTAEVLVISAGYLEVFNGQDGTLRRTLQLDSGGGGGTPNVDDFDGDGFPEVSSAFASAFVVADLQQATTSGECDAWPTAPTQDAVSVASANKVRTPPASTCAKDEDCGDLTKFACNEKLFACVCLHNGWKRTTEDDSSRVTGSSVFDFNGDGAAEVVYNDECRFRVYDGLGGDVWFSEPSESRTRIEYPVVADVDNDGNAEIVFATSTESGFCSQGITGAYNTGVEVWGDKSDSWVSARRVWNQHAYHVTNVTESGALPLFEPESWKPYAGRLYNTYRSNPRVYNVAPDLAIQGIQVSSPDAVCGQLSNLLDITVQVANAGDLRVGPGVTLSFYGTWPTPASSGPLHVAGGAPLTLTLQSNLEPGESILVTAGYDAANDAPGVLPSQVRVVVDEANAERECIETNNDRTADVTPGVPLPDLRVEVDVTTPPACPNPLVQTKVFNDGSAPAANVVVRYYAGDPNAGGKALHDEVLPGPIDPGTSVSLAPALANFPKGLLVKIYAAVDPDGLIPECNDGNNGDSAQDKLICTQVQ